MIKTKEGTMLTRDEYDRIAKKEAKKVADDLPDDINPLLLISALIDTTRTLRFVRDELFEEEEK